MTDVNVVHRLLHRHRLLQLIARSGAHTLRNVSQTLQMSTDLMRGVPEADVSIPELVDHASFRLLDLADRLGQWSLTKARAPQPGAVSAILAPILDLVHNHPSRDQATLDISIPEEFPLVNVIADDVLEATWELVTNALKSSSRGKVMHIQITASVNGHFVELRCTDDGPGVSAEVIPTLFTVMDRGSDQVPQLGLAVARALLRDQDGDLGYEPGTSGATFVGTIPVWRRT